MKLPLLVLMLAGCSTVIEARAGFVAPTPILQVRWHRQVAEDPLLEYKPQQFAAASSDGMHVFVGSSSGTLWSFDTRDGAISWRQKLNGEIASKPRLVSSEGVLYIGTRAGALYALESRTGAVRWKYEIKGPIESEPSYQAGVVYFTSGENRVYAVDAERGVWKWQYDRESPESFTIRGHAAPLVWKGKVYVGFSDGYLACLQASTGDVLWARSLAGEATRFVDVDSTPLLVGETLYVSSYSGGVYALDPHDGSVKWRFEVEGAGTVRVAHGRVYFAAAKLGVYCLDGEGRLVWRQALAEGGELSTPLLVGPYLFVSSAQSGAYVADAATGRLYQFFAPGHGVTAEPTSDGRQVYLLSNGGYFYAFSITRPS